MALAGANSQAVVAKRKPLLVICRHNVLQLFQRKRPPVAVHRVQQFRNTDPAGFVEFEPDPSRLMSQDQAQKLAGSDGFFVRSLPSYDSRMTR